MGRELGPATQRSYEAIIADWAPWLSPTSKVCMDKSVTNGTRMPWLNEVFPNAYFIGIFRNGYAAAEGIQRKAKPKKGAKTYLGTDRYPIQLAADQWVAANEKIIIDSPKVEHFFSIQYEQLIEDPIAILSQIWEFLGVPPPLESTFDGRQLTINGTSFLLLNSTNEDSIARLGVEGINELRSTITPTMNKLGYSQ